jgi:hypothetical protein
VSSRRRLILLGLLVFLLINKVLLVSLLLLAASGSMLLQETSAFRRSHALYHSVASRITGRAPPRRHSGIKIELIPDGEEDAPQTGEQRDVDSNGSSGDSDGGSGSTPPASLMHRARSTFHTAVDGAQALTSAARAEYRARGVRGLRDAARTASAPLVARGQAVAREFADAARQTARARYEETSLRLRSYASSARAWLAERRPPPRGAAAAEARSAPSS